MREDERDRALAELEAWGPDESLFRDWERVRRGALAEAEFLARYGADEENLELALHPERIETQLREDRFIGPGRNVSVIKHPRYLPLFLHEHDFFEINYVLSGGYVQQLEDRSVELRQGDLCILAPQVRHGIAVFDDSVVLNILIRHSTFLDIFLHAIREKTKLARFFSSNLYGRRRLRYALLHAGRDERIRGYVLDMCMEQAREDAYSDRIICSLLTIFFNELLRRHGDSIEIPEMRAVDERAGEMLDYAAEHCAEITLQGLAERFHYSRQYCARLIRDAAGCSFTELVGNARLRRAERLLAETGLSVADIGERLGYQNPETFIRAFKRGRGCTPARYRRDARGASVEGALRE